MPNTRERFVSVDVETSGPIPGEFSLLTLGACDVDRDELTYSCTLRPLNQNADPEALAATGLSLSELARTGTDPAEAMNDFAQWLQSLSAKGDRLVFVGFNAPFDWSFVNYYFHRFRRDNPFGFSALDIKAYYMGATGCAWGDTRSSLMSKHLQPRRAPNHDALEDALYQAELFRLIRSLRVSLESR
jgi:ribonuclease T